MNVKDVESPPQSKWASEMAAIVLDRQSFLEDHYWIIENRPSRIIDPTTRAGQVLIKDFLWRITEEVGEALEARMKREEQDKIFEELADALHFVAGLCIITDCQEVFRANFCNSQMPPVDLGSACHEYIKHAGMLGNTLKLKPWKQTDILTDLPEFKTDLSLMIISFMDICFALGMKVETLYDFYYRKSVVNEFRIKSNY